MRGQWGLRDRGKRFQVRGRRSLQGGGTYMDHCLIYQSNLTQKEVRLCRRRDPHWPELDDEDVPNTRHLYSQLKFLRLGWDALDEGRVLSEQGVRFKLARRLSISGMMCSLPGLC